MEAERAGTTRFLTDREKIRVLLVESDTGDPRFVEGILAKCSEPVEFSVERVGSLSAAVECLGDSRYDVVLLDLMLPDGEGIETVRRVSRVNPCVPLIVLTDVDDETGLLAIENGATDCQVKDPSLEHLLGRKILFALERQKKQKFILDTDRRLQEASQELYMAKRELEKTTQALQASEANLRKVILTSPDGIVIADKDGIVQFVNPAAEFLFGRKAEELLGDYSVLPVTKDEATELEIVHRDGEPGIAEMQAVETDWNGHNAYLMLFHDITERKQAKETLKKANEKLREYGQLKDEFVSTASHELRTPLTIIMGAIRLVLDEIPGQIAEEQREVLSTAMRNVERLGRIVDSLLNISKIESGKLDLRKSVVNICELVKDTVCSYTSLSREKGIHLDYEVPQAGVNICLDQDKIKQVLINLISNSLKFTPEGGWIKVACARQDDGVGVSVQDSGMGIASENIPKLFNKFTQFGRKAGPGEKGTGLGLAIAKKLVEMHKGTIEVESEVGRGTTFTVSLPFTTEAEGEGVSAEGDEIVEETLVNNHT